MVALLNQSRRGSDFSTGVMLLCYTCVLVSWPLQWHLHFIATSVPAACPSGGGSGRAHRQGSLPGWLVNLGIRPSAATSLRATLPALNRHKAEVEEEVKRGGSCSTVRVEDTADLVAAVRQQGHQHAGGKAGQHAAWRRGQHAQKETLIHTPNCFQDQQAFSPPPKGMEMQQALARWSRQCKRPHPQHTRCRPRCLQEPPAPPPCAGCRSLHRAALRRWRTCERASVWEESERHNAAHGTMGVLWFSLPPACSCRHPRAGCRKLGLQLPNQQHGAPQRPQPASQPASSPLRHASMLLVVAQINEWQQGQVSTCRQHK